MKISVKDNLSLNVSHSVNERSYFICCEQMLVKIALKSELMSIEGTEVIARKNLISVQ